MVNRLLLVIQEVYRRNPANCIILKIFVFNNFVLAEELIAKIEEALNLACQLVLIYVEN